jgi:hypothetical protein
LLVVIDVVRKEWKIAVRKPKDQIKECDEKEQRKLYETGIKEQEAERNILGQHMILCICQAHDFSAGSSNVCQ